MNNFIFSIPTIAYFGKGQINILGETIKAHGGSKVLLAYGGEDHKKKVVMHPLLNPKFSVLDPEYTYTVPEHHSMAGVGGHPLSPHGTVFYP